MDGDERFDEILIKEINLKITEAFSELEYELRETPYGLKKDIGEKGKIMLERKANQMRFEINNLIDSQVKRIIDLSNTQLDNGNQVPVGQG